jgi:hypothetical protein
VRRLDEAGLTVFSICSITPRTLNELSIGPGPSGLTTALTSLIPPTANPSTGRPIPVTRHRETVLSADRPRWGRAIPLAPVSPS